jgi:hypothetical protein
MLLLPANDRQLNNKRYKISHFGSIVGALEPAVC